MYCESFLEEITFLLDTVNTALGAALRITDVIGSYVGLRPLIDTCEGRSADVSRDYAVVELPFDVISAIGGKLTEYRYTARDVLDHVIRLWHLPAANCRTRDLPLIGILANPGPRCWLQHGAGRRRVEVAGTTL
ncbi:hypothetical protein DIJ64_09775 [Mycobacterium leprae]|uniref:Uncharacterized protein n=1 Tax=Mycobacterium leprae TaxID=1769 RepID=A0AAD0KT53_MYCLR|nr:hypothetical protein DIJ64_09775 [Mycobacterium leprae]OAR19917.1 hypothetical protein A8144_13025 [Mycobacterium leprae 3125609]OAX72186.1 hypothetical protein A3216_00010 [Mycobacterium leprae 7935681]